MITDEMIKQTKFYMGEDGKCYLVRDVRTVKMVTLICTRDGSESDLLLGDDVCSRFEPAEASFEPFIKNQVVAARPAATKPPAKIVRGPYKKRAKAKAKHVAGLRGPKNPSSQFKGVKKSKKPYADGRDCFEVNFYDKHTKKVNYLGSFDNEYLAAAAYQERAGNTAEAQKLRGMAKQPRDEVQRKADTQEQKENNPDRPKLKTWICKKCGIDVMHPTKPFDCINCHSTNTLKEVL